MINDWIAKQEDIVMSKNRKQQESATGKSAKKEQTNTTLNDWPDWFREAVGEELIAKDEAMGGVWSEAERGVATARIRIKEPV